MIKGIVKVLITASLMGICLGGTVSASSVNTMGGTNGSTTGVSNTSSTTGSNPSNTNFACTPSNHCKYEWASISKVRLYYRSYGHTGQCAAFVNDTKYPGGYLSCSNSTSMSRSVTAGLSGSWPAGAGNISAMVNYNVTQTTTMSVTDTIPEPPYTKGGINVRPAFYRHFRVKQQRSACIFGGGRVRDHVCYKQKYYAYAITELYLKPVYLTWIDQLKH